MPLIPFSIIFFLFLSFYNVAVLSKEDHVNAISAGVYSRPAITNEWAWALRGGGIHILSGFDRINSSFLNKIGLLVIDSKSLASGDVHHLYEWVERGGVLIYSGVESDLVVRPEFQALDNKSYAELSELLGVDYAGTDPAQVMYYPRITNSNPIISPFILGDGIKLGRIGIGHPYKYKPRFGTDVIALSRRISPGGGSFSIDKDNMTITTHNVGKGVVMFLGFSLGDIAACYSSLGLSTRLDCSGAGTAHALMRWVTANLLWEVKGWQIPLPTESPGPGRHAVIITGDVHNNSAETEAHASVTLADIFYRHSAPLTLYIEGIIGERSQDLISLLRQRDIVDISTHGYDGKIFMSSKFRLGQLGLFMDLKKSERLVGVPSYDSRKHLISFRSHGWLSDKGAWNVFHFDGIGLVFDHVADTINQSNPLRLTPLWYKRKFKESLFVPYFEHNVSTAWADFKLSPLQSLNISSLASAEPEPAVSMPYHIYTDYVIDVHSINHRLSSMGGVTEVWLWHPEGVKFNDGFMEVESTLQTFINEPDVTLLRGDELATWRANRERYSVSPNWDSTGRLTSLDLSEPRPQSLPLPRGASAMCSSVSYWTLGKGLPIKGWKSSTWQDPYGRTITRYSH